MHLSNRELLTPHYNAGASPGIVLQPGVNFLPPLPRPNPSFKASCSSRKSYQINQLWSAPLTEAVMRDSHTQLPSCKTTACKKHFPTQKEVPTLLPFAFYPSYSHARPGALPGGQQPCLVDFVTFTTPCPGSCIEPSPGTGIEPQPPLQALVLHSRIYIPVYAFQIGCRRCLLKHHSILCSEPRSSKWICAENAL